MPELAEVEHSRRLWDVGLQQPITGVLISRPQVRVFKGTDLAALQGRLTGQRFTHSEAKGKQMALRFGEQQDLWLGLHLGMAGELRVEPPDFPPGKHDHLVLRQAARSLVFFDGRHFGRVLFHEGADAPAWWTRLAPSVMSDEFTAAALSEFLQRRKRAPLKAVLLMQERFPGVGNWMADEILWRAGMHPAAAAGSLDPAAARRLWQTVRRVSRLAVETVDDDWNYPPNWLFRHRWDKGGNCPRCRTGLRRETIGGRTTCWCPQCQPSG